MTKTYANVTPAQYEQLMTEIKQNGAAVDANLIHYKGVTMSYTYQSVNEVLTLTIESKHFPASLMSDEAIFEKIEENARLTAS